MSTIAYNVEEPIFKVENVCLNYDKPILKDINFQISNITRPDVAQGQVTTLLGRSGIGKTQLFKVLSGLTAPSSGNVLVGRELQPVRAGEVGVVAQNYLLFNHRTVRKNLLLSLLNSGVTLTKEQITHTIEQYATEFSILEHLDKYPLQLSGGQRQRVSIIQQILTGNKFILLDEPFSGLDAIVKERVIALLRRVSTLNEYNTMIVVSHDIESSLAISDSILVLAKPNENEGATIVQHIDLAQMGLAWIDADPYERRLMYKDVIQSLQF